MKNDLIERYIYAATKRLPKKMQEDVSQELRTLIDDMLAERCGDITPEEKDIKIVLTELGTPNELYEKYNPQTDKCLIGSPYYSTYKYVLKIVLLGAGGGILISSVLSTIIDFFELSSPNATDFFITLFTDLFISIPSALVWAFAFVTILFAIFYHKGIKIDSTSNLDDLPPVPKAKQNISKADCIVGIVFSVVFLCVFLFAPQILCVIKTTDAGITTVTPIFNTDVIRASWYLVVLFGAVGIIREIIKLIEGRYNKKIMFSTIIANAISAVLSIWWLTRDNLINPEFAANITKIFDKTNAIIIPMFTHFQIFLLVVILFALVLDTATTIFKSLKQ